VVQVVRQLVLDFLYQENDSRAEPEPNEVALAAAFSFAESHKDPGTRLTSLSPLAIPFWVVQVSETKSIVLRAAMDSGKTFQFTENKNLGELRRIFRSEITEPANIPDSAEKILSIVEDVQELMSRIETLEEPGPLAAVGSFFHELDPNVKLHWLFLIMDSQRALQMSEEFQRIRDAAKARVEGLEELQSLAKEVLHGHLSVLENLTVAETERWKQRLALMEERTSSDSTDLERKKEDEFYSLAEKHRIDLRAVTADFSRAFSDLEAHFSNIVERIQEARTGIGARGDEVEGALGIYRELIDELSAQGPRLDSQVQMIAAKAEDVRRQTGALADEFEKKKAEVTESVHSQTEDRKRRLEELASELQQKQTKLEELKKRATSSVDIIEKGIEARFTALQSEFLNLMLSTLDHEDITDLAPLTQLGINTYVAHYDDETLKVFAPCFSPTGRTSDWMEYHPLTPELEEIVKRLILETAHLSKRFDNSLRETCYSGNVLTQPDSFDALLVGLDILQRRMLLEEGAAEMIEATWNKYAARCPKCGKEIEGAVSFCPKCGQELKQSH